MTEDARWVRPMFLSLTALVGLIVMVWGLIVGAVGAFHIYEPKYGRVEADQGDVAGAFRTVYGPLLELGTLQGTTPPGASDALARAANEAERQALERAKDRGYNRAVTGALAFVLGGFVLLIGSSGAKRSADKVARSVPPAERAGPAPVPAAPVPRQTPPQQPPPRQAMPSQTQRQAPPPPPGRAVPVPPRPAGGTVSPVGRLQESPAAAPKRSTRKAAPPKRAAKKKAEPAAPAPQAATPPVPRAPEQPAPPPARPTPVAQPPPAPPAAPPAAPARPVTPPPAAPPPASPRPMPVPPAQPQQPPASPPPFRPPAAPSPPPPAQPEAGQDGERSGEEPPGGE